MSEPELVACETEPSELTMMQWLAVADPSTGRYRCPECGKFRRLKDFGKQQTCVAIPNGHVDFVPACNACREKEDATP